ncbi:MAG: anaerobic sulfite reductase subunit AsrA [Oscillospiraceae bacterium]|nr:anaerobic sulfite reductase subunit AsrA [Oscillospiraceae bacterium]
MAYKISESALDAIIAGLSAQCAVYAPRLLAGWGTSSDVDIVGYAKIEKGSQIAFDKKSMYSFKEAILPISQTLFYFTEDEMREPRPAFAQAVVFLRGCELHGLSRLDDVYRADGKLDFYYEQLRSNTKFIVIGCEDGFESCFCESMGASGVPACDGYILSRGDGYVLISNFDELTDLVKAEKAEQIDFTPVPAKNTLKVNVPDEIPEEVATSPIWDEYDARCIICGRCNFVCPTCACFTMQDIFYDENVNAGERRRVWASCQIDGYTDIAGGIAFRKTKGERMRFKALHKLKDHKGRYGRNMCVGCGRCDDVCPEYISFSACVGKVAKACKEVGGNG